MKISRRGFLQGVLAALVVGVRTTQAAQETASINDAEEAAEQDRDSLISSSDIERTWYISFLQQ